jgi:benzil reductase ((S)-benzoin forming)
MYIITGGGTGIGRALALQLATRQQKVLIIGRRVRPLEKVASHSAFISYLSANVATKNGRQKIVDHVKDVPHIKGLIHCAALILPIKATCDIQFREWQNTMATNITAPLFLTQLLLKQLKGGRVLHLDSELSEIPTKGLTAYCVSKAGLFMLFQTWQKDDLDVSIAGVKPGIVNTDMPKRVLQAEYGDEKLRAFLQKAYKENFLFAPETVALFLAWLLLDVDAPNFESTLWDIRDTSHHSKWLVPPHKIPIQK